MNITDKMVITAGDVLIGHVNAPEQAIYKAARHALNAALAVSLEVDAALLGVTDTIEESGGWWKPCSGCYDTEDGHPTMKYGHSCALKTDVGLGCRECGGLGAVWEYYSEADLAEMQREFLTPEDTHSDDRAVDRFAEAMKAKLAKKRAEGRGGWEDKDRCSREFLSALLREHVEKGDPLDVMNFAMMIHQRGERIAPASAEPVTALAAMVDAWESLEEGQHSRDSMQRWISGALAPAIRKCREALPTELHSATTKEAIRRYAAG